MLTGLLHATMTSTFPQLAGLEVEIAWSGLMAYARHLMPQVGGLGGGLWCCTAFGGHGMNTTAIGGRVLAEAIAGQSDRIRLFAPFGLDEKFVDLVRRCGRARGFGDFWIHMLVAEGAIEIAVEPLVAWWDMAAVKVIVEEAGGRFSTLTGQRTANGGSAVSTNALLHEPVLAALR